MTAQRGGRHALLEQLIAARVRWIFANPGTTEQGVVDAIQDYPELELILALHEAVAVGAAEGFARATGEPGVVLLHTAPGLGNAMGMLSNANLGHTPMIVLVGDMPTAGRFTEPVLSGPILDMARPVSRWVHEMRTPDEVPQVIRRAFKVAVNSQGPVVLVLPSDVMDAATDAEVAPISYVWPGLLPAAGAIDEAVDTLLAATRPAILVGDGVAHARASDAVGRLADALGAPIYTGYASEACVPPGHPLDGGGVPLFAPAALAHRFADHDCVVALGSEVFRQAFPASGPPLPLSTQVVQVGLDAWELAKNQPALALQAHPATFVDELLSRLPASCAGRFAARRDREVEIIRERRGAAQGGGFGPSSESADAMSAVRVLRRFAEIVANDPIIVDEAVSAGPALAQAFPPRPAGWFRSRGGGLGAGMSIPIGLSLGAPGRQVLAFVGDGSATYTIAALWTGAHLRLPICWVVLNNHSYRMLKLNTTAYLGGDVEGRRFMGADIDDPAIDFVSLARSFGVPAVRVSDLDDIGAAIRDSVEVDGPFLIDVTLNDEQAR